MKQEKSAEAFCKIIILNEFGEEEGTKIIGYFYSSHNSKI